MAKLSLCRTPALGGKTYQCGECGEVSERFHSCGDRHCPLCSGCKRFDFADRAERLILSNVIYYQVVFTLPSDLSLLAQANREVMADLLFSSAAKSLDKTIRTQQGYEPASMMVLHTWNQRLEPHWHVHALVPGGGPSLTGNQWKNAEPPPGAPNSDGFYLVDAISLREIFRKRALFRLKRLYSTGKLKLRGRFAYLQDPRAWEKFCEKLNGMDWVSYIQPPPTETCTAAQVVRYLTRYLTGGPISDGRIIAADNHTVTFLAREGTRVGGQRCQVPVTITSMEFVRRWCDHIQPNHLTKTRYFGGWSGSKRDQYQSRGRELLAAISEQDTSGTTAPASVTEASSKAEVREEVPVRCPSCGGSRMYLISTTRKPSWSKLLTHLNTRCPAWYAEWEYQEFCEYIEREYGVGYDDWYSVMWKVSTMSEPPPRREEQPYLPGLAPVRDFTLESF